MTEEKGKENLGCNYICPKHDKWMEIHRHLCRFVEKMDTSGQVEPPTPPLLALWRPTTQIEKMVRWQDTIKWAKQYGCSHLIPDLTKEEQFNTHSA